MRFKQWPQVIGQEEPPKTQTRRLVKEDDYTWMNALGVPFTITEVCGIGPSGRHYLKWAVGKTYAVQRPDGKTMGRTPPIREIRRERLGDISVADCLAEGISYHEAYDACRETAWGTYTCPVCKGEYREDHTAAFACLWNCCGGDWKRDKDSDVFVLSFERGK